MKSRAFIACLLIVLAGDGTPCSTPLAPESICNLPTVKDDGWHIVAGRLIMHAHGYLLLDAGCPTKTLSAHIGEAMQEFTESVDSKVVRFSIPLGAGTWTNIELLGKFGDNAHIFVVNRVTAYQRHDVLDAAWHEGASQLGPGELESRVEDMFEQVGVAQVIDIRSETRPLGGDTLRLGTDGSLMDLTKEMRRAPGARCYSKVALETYAQVQCQWHHSASVDVVTWIFERDGNAWRLVKESDGVVR